MASTMTHASDLGADQGASRGKAGLKIERYFSHAGISPFDEVEW